MYETFFLRNYWNFYDKLSWFWEVFLNYRLTWLKELIGLTECPFLCPRPCPWRAVNVGTAVCTIRIQQNMVTADLQCDFTHTFNLHRIVHTLSESEEVDTKWLSSVSSLAHCWPQRARALAEWSCSEDEMGLGFGSHEAPAVQGCSSGF